MPENAARPGLLDRKLLFVSGKGGVGKTSIASALGMLAVQMGKRTLVCETDAKGNLADFFSSPPLQYEPTEVQSGLFAMTMETESSLKEYLALQLHLPLLSRIGPIAKTFDFVATAAPGVKEILTVGKFAWEVRERHYDLVVVDASATGHVVGQLAAPVALGELVRVGLVRQQTQWMHDLMRDPATTGLVVVATPEEMPVTETIELLDRVEAETDIDVACVIANRVLPELFSRPEEELFSKLKAPAARAALRTAVGAAAGTGLSAGTDLVLDAAELAVSLRRNRAEHLDRLRAALPPGLPLLNVPYLFTRSHGVRTTRQVAEFLGQELF